MKRRQFVKNGFAFLGSLPLLNACDGIYSRLCKEMGQKIPEAIQVNCGQDIDPVFHILSRAAYGPWPGDIEQVRKQGAKEWIESQLQPEKIDDRACDLRSRRFETLFIPAGACYDFKKQFLRRDIIRHSLLRATYSKRQLFEILVGFWSDHLNISMDKADCVYLKPADDRLVIRTHALGKFKNLIKASALSPAMLVYLDGNQNHVNADARVPNENYARELLELHTLGIHGGYTQEDVYEVARCLTGWRLHEPWQRAIVYFDASNHDNGEKYVLGHTIPAGGGAADLDRVVDIVCDHPSTAAHISKKIASRFINSPSSALVARVAAEFKKTSGDIKSLLRIVLNSEEFANDAGSKTKRPFTFMVSALRLLGADTHAHDDLLEFLQRMGHVPFQYPTPDGYPDESSFWMGTLLWRWKFGLALAQKQIKSVSPDLDELFNALKIQDLNEDGAARLFAHFIGREPLAVEANSISQFLCSNLNSSSPGTQGVPLPVAKAGFEKSDGTQVRYEGKRSRSNGTQGRAAVGARLACPAERKAALIAVILCSPAFQRY